MLGEKQPDSRCWRWIAPVLPGSLYGGDDPPDLKVDFLVFGYRPRARPYPGGSKLTSLSVCPVGNNLRGMRTALRGYDQAISLKMNGK